MRGNGVKKGEWSVIFLLDNYPPTKIVLLKRAPHKKFAPNLYTGIGGSQEEGESALEGAQRELLEETGLSLPITQFAQSIVDGSYFLHYFWGILDRELPECNEGCLEWVSVKEILNKEIISTTFGLLEEWKKRGFKVDQCWTMYTQKAESGLLGRERIVEIKEVVNFI